jgi:hypothetical protein
MTTLTKDVLTTATLELLGGRLEAMPLERLHHLITLTQHATDLLLNEIERRGELTFSEDGVPILPYISDYGVETILTRPDRDPA